MSYSDVVVVLEKGMDVLVKKEAEQDVLDFLKSADKISINENSIRYDFKMMKWYEETIGAMPYQLHQLLEELNEVGDKIRIWKLTEDHIWDDYAPLDTWGSYRDHEIDPRITLEFEPEYSVLTEPYTIEEILLLKNQNNEVQGIVEVTLTEMIERDTEGFMDLLAERLVGGLLWNIGYSIVTSDTDRMLLEVSGDVTPTLDMYEEAV